MTGELFTPLDHTGARLVWSTETPPPPSLAYDDRTWIRCRVCGYDRPVGMECGLPCL